MLMTKNNLKNVCGFRDYIYLCIVERGAAKRTTGAKKIKKMFLKILRSDNFPLSLSYHSQTNSNMNKEEIYAALSGKILDIAKAQNVAPWQMPWMPTKDGFGGGWVSRAKNLNGYAYKGINALYLDSLQLDVAVFGTFNQWKKEGLSVKKGEKGLLTVKFVQFYFKDLPNGKRVYATWAELLAMSKTERDKYKKGLKLGYDYVFHIGQIDSEKNPEKYAKLYEKWQKYFSGAEKPKAEEKNHWHETSEKIVERWDVSVRNVEQSEAYYTPSLDRITMPMKAQFPNMADYYSVLFHEGAHASGHKKRLNREGVANIDTSNCEKYGFEELVAEIATVLICNCLGINQNFDNSTAYVKHWLSKLTENGDWLPRAFSQAMKAADWVLNWANETETVPTESEAVEIEELSEA
jgi:hypothetical protein